MTTIAYRDGEMAGDTLISSSGIRMGQQRKIARRRDGAVCGACGSASLIRAVLEWFVAGETLDARPNFGNNDAQAIIVRPDGTIEWHDDSGFHRVDAPFFAIGSGRDIAIGAMAADAKARKAVQLAAIYDPGATGGRIMMIRLGASD